MPTETQHWEGGGEGASVPTHLKIIVENHTLLILQQSAQEYVVFQDAVRLSFLTSQG
jgi:hypothetical protein